LRKSFCALRVRAAPLFTAFPLSYLAPRRDFGPVAVIVNANAFTRAAPVEQRRPVNLATTKLRVTTYHRL
jgi:hypothetical protein